MHAGQREIVVDVIDDTLFLGVGLGAALARAPRGGLRLGVSAPTWFHYLTVTDAPAPVVILRDELDDHVPTVLKVRALTLEGVRSVVVAESMTTVRARRLREAGVSAIVTRENDLEDLLARLAAVGATAGRAEDAPEAPLVEAGVAKLSDRQLQVACLYVGPTAPSTRLLAESLSLPWESVRTHLQRARSALGVQGRSREVLRERLAEQGWVPR